MQRGRKRGQTAKDVKEHVYVRSGSTVAVPGLAKAAREHSDDIDPWRTDKHIFSCFLNVVVEVS